MEIGPEPIVIGNNLATITLKLFKSECVLKFYNPNDGAECTQLVRGTHWQLFHPDLNVILVKELYDIFDSEYYYVKYQLTYSDLSNLFKYSVRDSVLENELLSSHIHYQYTSAKRTP